MAYNEAETRFYLIDPVLREKGYDEHWKLRLETPAPVEPIGNKGRRRSGTGRVDYLLCVQAGKMPKPLPVSVIEAKAESEDPLKGMQQAKGYADCKRFEVQYVFATNGHRYGEFDLGTQAPDGPFLFPAFPSHDELTARYSKDKGIDITQPEAALLFMTDSQAYSKPRYYQVRRFVRRLKRFCAANSTTKKRVCCCHLLRARAKPLSRQIYCGACTKPGACTSQRCFCVTAMNCGDRRTTKLRSLFRKAACEWSKPRGAKMLRKMPKSKSPPIKRWGWTMTKKIMPAS